MNIHGDGRYVVLLEADHRYQSGKKAHWPELHLFAEPDEAHRYADRVSGARRVSVFELPADPRDAVASDLPFTQAGNRQRYGEDVDGHALRQEMAAALERQAELERTSDDPVVRHRRACRDAGCTHSPYYRRDGEIAMEWCELCRTAEVSPRRVPDQAYRDPLTTGPPANGETR